MPAILFILLQDHIFAELRPLRFAYAAVHDRRMKMVAAFLAVCDPGASRLECSLIAPTGIG